MTRFTVLPLPRLSSCRASLAGAVSLLSALVAASLSLNSVSAQLPAPGLLKLHGRGTQAAIDNSLGTAVAASDTWIVAGEPGNDDAANSAGAAYVYQTPTGRFVRKLIASDAIANANFGSSAAISGSLAIIGAPYAPGGGAAYVFDLLTGKQLQKLTASDGGIFDQFGSSVALQGDLALVGSPAHTAKGAVYLFHARKGGLHLGKLLASNGSGDDEFGGSVALSGKLALVGARLANADKGAAYLYDVSLALHPAPVLPELNILTAGDGAALDGFGGTVAFSGKNALIAASGDDGFKGSAYLFDAITGVLNQKFTDPSGVAGHFFGSSLALNGNLAVIGAANSNRAYLFNAIFGGGLMTRLFPPDTSNNNFGTSVALAGNLAVIGANEDSDLGSDAGAAYVYQQLATPPPLSQVARTGDSAPGTVGISYSSFNSAYVDQVGQYVLSGSLSDRSSGIWSSNSSGLNLAARTGKDLTAAGLPGVNPSRFGEIIAKHNTGFLMQTYLRGAGITGANNLAWLRSNYAGTLTVILRHGSTFPELAGSPVFQSFPELVQKDPSGITAAAYVLKKSAATSVNAGNDSGVTQRTATGVTNQPASNGILNREGATSPTGDVLDTFGQFMGRICISQDDNFVSFPAFYYDASSQATAQAVIWASTTGASRNPAALQGGATAIPGNPVFRSFVGETLCSTITLMRAFVSGTGITTANDEGLFRESSNTALLREGQAVNPVGLPGVTIKRFLGYWGHAAGNSITALVTLAGPGVNAGNDLALLNGMLGVVDPHVLLREGDVVGTDDAARVGVIQRVDVDSTNGYYYILASLTGSPARNQAIFTGNMESGNNTNLKGLRLPSLTLRKGQSYQRTGGITTSIKTFSMPTSTDRTGAGAKGHSQAINDDGLILMTLEFANRSKEVWRGTF